MGKTKIPKDGEKREPVSDPAPIIAVQNLTAGYGERTILERVTFQVYPGEILVILGGNGSGKSTLLKHMIGLYRPAGGRILIHGVDIASAGEEEMKRVRMDLGVLFQTGALFGSMDLFENIALPLREHTDLSPEEIEALVRLKLALVRLSGYAHHLPSELSGGMRKRAALARAMALDPAILFFDEPSAGLDPVASTELDALITRINAGLGTTMVVVTHELESIFHIADRVIMLDPEARGIIAEGDPRRLQESSPDPRVIHFFHPEVPGLREA